MRAPLPATRPQLHGVKSLTCPPSCDPIVAASITSGLMRFTYCAPTVAAAAFTAPSKSVRGWAHPRVQTGRLRQSGVRVQVASRVGLADSSRYRCRVTCPGAEISLTSSMTTIAGSLVRGAVVRFSTHAGQYSSPPIDA